MPAWLIPTLISMIGGTALESLFRSGATKAGVTSEILADKAAKKLSGTVIEKGLEKAASKAPAFLAKGLSTKALLGAGLGFGGLVAGNIAFSVPGLLYDLWGSKGGEDNSSEIARIPQLQTQTAHATDRNELGRVLDEAALRDALAQYTAAQDSTVDDLFTGRLV